MNNTLNANETTTQDKSIKAYIKELANIAKIAVQAFGDVIPDFNEFVLEHNKIGFKMQALLNHT